MVRYYEMINENNSEENGQDIVDPYQVALTKYFHTTANNARWTLGKTYEVINGKVNILANICRATGKTTVLPFQFGTANTLNCDDMGLRTLKGSPESVNIFSCAFNNLTSLEYIPVNIRSGFNCANNSLLSLEGLDFNSYVGTLDLTYNNAELPLLRLLCVKRFVGFTYSEDAGNNSYFEAQKEYQDLEDIINHHIKTYSNIKERLVKCQYAMIKAGYKGNAKW